MNVFLTICVMLITLFFSTAQAEPVKGEAGEASYVVEKGDTLTAIVKKFPGTTVAGIAKTNNIANPDLIYPGAPLTFPVTRAVANATVRQTQAASAHKEMRVHVAPHGSSQVSKRNALKITCDAASILPRLLYPSRVSEQFEEMLTEHVGAKKEFPFSATITHGDTDYYLLVEEHCIATKIVGSLQIASAKVVEKTPRAHENTSALTPRQRVGIVTTGTEEADQHYSTNMGFAKFLARIEKELQEIMGPDEDVTPLVVPLALAILRKAEASEAALSLLKK